VLVLLVVLSLLLLTAYFGESSGGRLHGVQRDFLTVVSPLENAANKALKPVRNAIGWVGDTLHAKSQRDELLKQIDKLRREKVASEAERRGYRELAGLDRLDRLGVQDYRPVTATVVLHDPNVWYSVVTINKGESEGVQRNDPVINEEGLVGKVAEATSDGAVVDLITDSTMGVTGRVGSSGETGMVLPKVGEPNELVLDYLAREAHVNAGEYVVTSGTVAPPDESLYPPGLLIGQVTSVNEESGYTSVGLRPFANLHDLDIVQVLTYHPGSAPANLSELTSKLPSSQPQNGSAVQGEQLASTGDGG
jgi:rod shape-determining protein MreC